jgi:hypothetical protein
MSASQDRLTAKKRRAATQEDEKYTTPKATKKLRLPTLTKTTAAVPKATAKLQMPTLTKTASAAQKTTKYKPADTGIKINALGAGDYSGGGRLLEKAAKTVSGAVKGTGSAYANIAGSAVEGMGNLQENMQKGEYDKKLKQMDEYADFYKRSLAAGKNLNTGALLTAQQRAQFERLLKTQYSDAKIAQMRKLYGDATAAQKQRTMETAGAAFATADRLKAAADADVAAAKEGSGKVGQFLVDLGYTGTQMLGDTAANLLVPGAGMVSMATRVYGDASGEARREGKSAGQQALSGLKGATIEVLTEKLFGGLAKAYGKGTADEVVERIADKLTKTAKGKAAATWLINSGGEGVEEVISDVLNPLADRALGLDDGEGSVFKAEDLAQMGYDFLLGAAMGAVGGAGQLRAPQISETETTQQKLQMPQLALYTQKERARRSQDTMPDAESAVPVINVRNELPQGSSESIIPQVGETVKPQLAETASAQQAAPKLRMPTLSSAGLAQNEYSGRLWAQEAQRAATLDELGRKLGMRIELVDSVLNGQANGQYLSGRNTMQIAADAANPVEYVAAHEATHYLQEQTPAEYEAYKNATADYYRALYGESGLNYMVEGYKRASQEAGVQLDDTGAMDEIAADFTEKLMGDADLFARFAADNRTAAQKLLDALKAFISEVKTALTGRARDAAAQSAYGTDFATLEGIAAKWQAAFDAAAQNAKTAAQTDGGARYQIKQLDGRMMPVVDTQNDTRDLKAAERYLRTLVNTEHPFATILADAQPVYIGKDLPKEYKGSEYTFGMNRALRAVKMQAATNLDEMLLLAENGEWRENVKPKHAKDAQNGWYRYTTEFAVPVLNEKKVIDHYTVYDGVLVIRNDADGKSYLYDLVDVQKKKAISAPSFSAKKRSEVFAPNPSADSISAEGENVNRKFSLKTYSAEEMKQHAKEEQEFFGKTYNWNETGYITTNGTKLDFSGKHEGGPGGYRTVDHRDIRDALGDDYGGEEYGGSLVQFMSEGNIRVSPESGGINLSVLPTKAQFDALSDFVSKNRGEVVVDIDDINGNTLVSTEYPKHTHSSKVVNDIKAYFETGATPHVSDLGQFRYQLRGTADVEQELKGTRLRSGPQEERAKPTMPQINRRTGIAQGVPQITGKPTNVPVTREQARQRMAEEAAARAAAEEQRRAVPETMQRVGVAPFGSEADYAGAGALAKNAGNNERARRRMKKEMEKVPATEKDRMFARQVYAGQIAMEDIPATVDRTTVAKLADYYAAMDRTAETELLRQKRNIILEREAEKMEPLLGPDVEYDEGGLRESGKPSGKIARQFSTLRRNLQTPARICATEWGAEHGEKVYKTLFWPVTENNGRQVEWVNSMIDRVRTFKDSTGEERPLNRAERAIVQRLVETSAAEERVAKFSKQYAPAAENVKNGAGVADAAREFGIQKGTAEYEDLLNYAANLAAKADAKTQENVDAAAVDAAVEAYGELYGELYEAINTFLAAHGYKPIGFIEGYAPHMQPEETKTAFSKAMKLLGLDDTAMMLPTSISGQTADLKPYKQYDPFFQTRQGSKTEYDIAKGFENYIYYLGNIFYHTDDIMRIRAAANYMRKTYSSDEAGEMISWAEGARSFSDEQIEAFLRDYGIIGKGTRLSGEDARAKLNEYIDKLYEQIGDVSRYSEMVKYLDNYANRLAGKQNMADRGAEAATGRGSLNWINALTGKFGGAKLAFNVSSALNQTGQLPIVMAENGEGNTAKAIRDFFGSKEVRDDFVKSSNYLKGKKGVNWLIRDETTWEKVQSYGFAMTEAVDGFTAYVAVRSKYLKELNAGKSKSEAMRAADEYGRNVMGSRARGEKPMLFDTKNPFWQIVTRFQLEAMNSWEHISRDIPNEIRNIAKTQGKTKAAQALASRAGRYVVYAFLANLGVGALSGGSPVPFDVVGNLLDAYGAAAGMTKTAAIKTILDNVLQQVFDERLFGTDEPDDDDEADLWAAFESLFGNVANDVPVVGRAAALAGIGDQTLPVTDLSKLGDFAGAVKDKELFSADALDKGLAAGSEFVFGGNQLKKTVQGARAVAQGGVYGSNGRLRYEVEQSPWNVAQGLLFGKSALKESQEYYAGSDSTSRFSAEGTRLKEAKDAGDKTAEVVGRWWSKQQARITELYKEISDTNAGGADRRRLEEAAAAVRENALDTESTYKAAAEKYLQQGMDVDKAYREANRECFGAEYALEAYNKNVYERAQDARRNGVSYEDFYDYYFSTKDIEATDGMSATEWKLEYLRNSGMDESAQAALWLTDMASDSDVVEQMELEAGAGITLEQYYTYKLAASGSTKKAEKLDAINAADLTVEQKNAIYYAEGWAESKLREAPWYTGRRASKSAAPVLGTTYRPAPVLGERYEYYDAADNRPKPIIGQQYEYYGDGARPAPVIGEKYSPYFTDTVEQSSRPTPVIGEAYTW